MVVLMTRHQIFLKDGNLHGLQKVVRDVSLPQVVPMAASKLYVCRLMAMPLQLLFVKKELNRLVCG